jgi:cell wall-associated NlpC family hydrolase
VHAGFLAPAGDLPPVESRLTSLGCTVRGIGARRRRLAPGALLLPDETVERGEALTHDALRARLPRNAAAVAKTAQVLFDGTPYQWGGVTPWGADCSGLVQTAFRLHGILLPRDAWQQATVGEDAGTDPTALDPGDLLFFSDRDDGRVTHVGIALGSAGMVHAALGRGGYAVEHLDDTDDLYVEKLRSRVTGARRVR